jgi:hypothetical protein
MTRTAIVTGARSMDEVAAYLPGNYAVAASIESPTDGSTTTWYGQEIRGFAVVIQGEDRAGWTLDKYVSPRLASGLMTCREVVTR